MTTKTVNFHDKTFKSLKNLVDSTKLLIFAYDKNEYLVHVISNSTDLGKALRDKSVVGIIVEGTAKGTVCYDLVNNKRYVNKKVLSEQNILEYGTEHLFKELGNTKRELVSGIQQGNLFMKSFSDFLSNKIYLVELSQIKITYGSAEDIPMFYMLTLYNGIYKLNVTKQQMSLLTGCGSIKIHDTHKVLNTNKASDIVSQVLSIEDREGLRSILNNTYKRSG